MAIEIDIEKMIEKMTEMPEAKGKGVANKQEAVKLLKPGITAMKKKGYSMDEITKFLNENGLKISSATLKNYLQTKPRVPRTPKNNEE